MTSMLSKYNFGFTGTKYLMSVRQMNSMRNLLRGHPEWMEAHHGDCVGSDKMFHDFCRIDRPDITIVGHPPVLDKHRAFCVFDKIHPEKDYFERNEDIVNHSRVMMAVPKLDVEEIRSGTWHAIRYTRKMRKALIIIWPSGRIEYERC